MWGNIFSYIADYFRLMGWVFGQINDFFRPIRIAVLARITHNWNRMRLFGIIHVVTAILFIVLCFTPMVGLRNFLYLASMASLGVFAYFAALTGLLLITCLGILVLLKNGLIDSQVEVARNVVEVCRGGMFTVGNMFDRVVRIIASIFGNAEEVKAVMEKKEFVFKGVPILGQFSGNLEEMINYYANLYRKLMNVIVIDACVMTSLFFVSWGPRLGAIPADDPTNWWVQLGSKTASHPLNVPFVIAGILMLMALFAVGQLKTKAR